MALFQYFKKVDGNYPGTKLPDPQGALMKEVPSSLISAANTEIAAVLQASAAGTKAVRGTYLKISAEKKAKIGQRAADHGVLLTVQYYATKLSVKLTTGTMCIHPAGWSGCGIFEQHIREIISTKFSKTAIRENIDTRIKGHTHRITVHV